MQYEQTNVVYLDKSIKGDHKLQGKDQDWCRVTAEHDVQNNLEILLKEFHTVHVTSTGLSLLEKVRELESITTTCFPTLIFIETVLDSTGDHAPDAAGTEVERPPGTTFPPSLAIKPSEHTDAGGSLSGLALVVHLKADIERHNLSKLAIPVVLIHRPSIRTGGYRHELDKLFLESIKAGASDVIYGPLSEARVTALSVLAIRARIEAFQEQDKFLEQKRIRKRSWVGVDEEKPYAYLRESMVSTLMESICKPQAAIGAVSSGSPITITPGREAVITQAILHWSFAAHEFSDDELIFCAYFILKHALSMPELVKWRISDDDLKKFLLASRSAYNSFVLYHNFRHVVDVLQAVFYFLLQAGTLPPHPMGMESPHGTAQQSPIAALLTPFDALVLLISAIGHDVGHPGVNNAFLVALKAPLAQLYNDNSVLEAFHCAAYSQILRRYWSSAFEDTDVRKKLIKCILATDMQMHFKYMADLGHLQEKIAHNGGTDGFTPQALEEYKVLTLGILIKCADISNVARPFDIAVQWADVLQLEFHRQGEMETEVGIPTTLFGGPPDIHDIKKLGDSQINFMHIFAQPLFEGITSILPGMQFGIDEIKKNLATWKGKIDIEKKRREKDADLDKSEEGFQSPRSGSPERLFAATSPEASHPEGIPASGSTPKIPESPPMSTSQGSPDIPSAQTSPQPAMSGVGQAISTPDEQRSEIGRKLSFGLPVIPIEPFDTKEEHSRGLSGTNIANTQPLSGGKSTPNHLQLSRGQSGFFENNPVARPGTSSNASPMSGIRTVGYSNQPGTPPTPPVVSNNYSRPMSVRPQSAHHSFAARSSTAPTFASAAHPTSPTETQATEITAEGSEPVASSVDLDRPSSGYSSAFGTSTASSSGRSPGQATVTKATTSGYGSDPTSGGGNGHASPQRELRKKSSRFRFKNLFKGGKRHASEGASP